jgi:hypothetical protein
MHWKTESQPEWETQGDFHPARRGGCQDGRLPVSSFAKSTRSSLFPLALQDEGRPIIWLPPLFLFPDRQLSLT